MIANAIVKTENEARDSGKRADHHEFHAVPLGHPPLTSEYPHRYLQDPEIMRNPGVSHRPLMPRTGSSAAGTARTLATPRDQSGTANFASRGRGLTGKPVTESNLSRCTPAQIPA